MSHQIEQIRELSDETASCLTEVWEESVKATHDFLSAADIEALRPIVRTAFSSMEHLVCIKDAESAPLAFLGMVGNKIEMLFVHPNVRRKGLGRTLIKYAVEDMGAKYVDVNEQNSQATAFYESMMFKVAGRSETDAQGNPFPIIHMEKV